MQGIQVILEEFGLVLQNEPCTYCVNIFDNTDTLNLDDIRKNNCSDISRLQSYYNRAEPSDWHNITITISFTKSEE